MAFIVGGTCPPIEQDAAGGYHIPDSCFITTAIGVCHQQRSAIMRRHLAMASARFSTQ